MGQGPLNTRDWAQAAEDDPRLGSIGQIGVIRVEVPTIAEAVRDRYFEDATARHLAPTTIRKRRELLEGKLLRFCKARGSIC